MALLAVLAALAAAGAGVPAAARAAAAPPAARALTGNWEILPDPRFVGIAEHWYDGRAGHGWTPTTVPGVFDARALPQLFSGTVEWYRLTFTGPTAPPAFAWALSFQQVRRTADVWLNGVPLGTNGDPYAPFVFPARGLRAGQPNTLVVRVDNRKGAEPREGWWNWGGITRPVDLVPLGPIVTSNPGVMSVVRCSGPERCNASVLFDGVLSNRSRFVIRPRVSVTLAPPDGGPVTHAAASAAILTPGESERVRFTFPVVGPPDLWQPGHPALYSTRVTTYAGPTVSQVDTMQTGLRSIVARAGQLFVNGRAVQLSGASIEEDWPGRGAALTTGDMAQIVSELQALHANVTRSQYPLSQELLGMLDRAGIMVWSQAPIYHRDELLVTPAERRAALATLRSSVLQTRDHASVITNSVANELTVTPDTTPGTRDYLDDATVAVRALNPTLPVALDVLSWPNEPPQRTYDQFQLLGINNYFGWYAGPVGHSTANIADLAPYLETMHRDYPGQTLVMTEFGAEATFNGPATEKGTYQFQSDYVRQTLAIVRALTFMNGAIYWTLREYAVKPFWYGGGGTQVDRPRDSFHHKGLISYAGAPKPAFAVAAAEFAATPLFRGAPPPGARTPWTTVLVIVLSLAAIALLALFDIWLFAGLRDAARGARRARSGGGRGGGSDGPGGPGDGDGGGGQRGRGPGRAIRALRGEPAEPGRSYA